nr:MAG TPA: WWamide peptide [Caudoviricetes sp.]
MQYLQVYNQKQRLSSKGWLEMSVYALPTL